jgi:hypothetical protein
VADDIDSLLSQRAGGSDGSDVDALLADRAGNGPSAAKTSFHVPTAQERADLDKFNNEPQELPWYKRAEMGFYDPLVGAGQVVQHVLPDEMLNSTRRLFGLPEASTEEFDKEVRSREHGYQAKRAAAGQDGLDVARIGGNVSNPVNWFGGGEADGLWQSVKLGAKTGAFQALMQPVTDAGNFLYDKGIQAVVGGGTGGLLGGALYGLKNAFSYGVDAVRKAFPGDTAAQQAGAKKVVDDTLKAAGADPAKMDPNLYRSIQREADEALKAGVDPNPKVMLNRADAASLPVPINLTRGQAARDPMQFSWEVNSSKLNGAGEQLNQHLQNQNRALIENLNVLGAKDAPSTFDVSQRVIDKIQSVDDRLREKIGEAYQAVRDSAGRPAMMDAQAFADRSKDLLTEGKPELADLASLGDYLPEKVAKQYNDIIQGKVPLTVDTAQFFDRAWGAVQRGSKDDAEKLAIGHLRTAINEAPVNDQLGAEAMAAYKTARAMAKQRFDMIDANPAYKAIINSSSKAEPDKFFQTFVQGGNASDIASLKQLVGDDTVSALQKTTVGNLKKIALNRASDENGVFSQAAFNKVLQDPVQGPRIQELFKSNPEALDHLYRLGRVSENIIAFPKNHSVNTSNTSPTIFNTVKDIAKSEAGSSLVRLIPGGKAVQYVTQKATENAQMNRAVNDALSPGVTASPLKELAPPRQVGKLSDVLTRVGAGYAANESTNKRKK